ncbi:DUF883 family protein [Ralstonia insidiosa]|jgi:ElaB/YqjD/DUF883 family membrane-anchored ribosome-binding protein|uniref:DUF883 domain-containing protein n=1 Tax=Ralstonia insidiosa TaxID=190721 RepID=A0A191ZSS7_9RALS|nr:MULTISPECIES: DUF883 family protein [Ralstonia]ANH72697.1 hypothetical protein ACS15_0209 [Ralstonia insidiosa]ANJ71142.1 hypothetical protein A9Y76_00995 [Ralstonia insidiosa]EPX96188.1 hypothetical protein C404_19685 [Ralstonia sp. AU12-08]KAB0471723.1 DUF883 family protein [Ralstonia insidiosa]MBY4707705.1 DUF883 family protein [Ralstonia insidiosa]
MSLFASQRIRNRFEDVSEHARRALNGTSAAVNHARHAARPAVEDVQSLLHSLEDAIEALADEGSAEASRARRTLRARADALRHTANDRAHQARERMDWALGRTQETISAAPFKSIGVAVAIGAAIGLVVALAGGGSRRAEAE